MAVLVHFGTFDVENYSDLLLAAILERRLSDLGHSFVNVSPLRTKKPRVLEYESTQGLGVVTLSEWVRQVEAEVAKLQTDFARVVTALGQWLDHDGADDARASLSQGKGKKNRQR